MKTILLLDDESVVMELLRDVLKKYALNRSDHGRASASTLQ